MFPAQVFQQRRARLAAGEARGLLLFMGNVDAPMNYHDNAYPFVQDASFRYFFGLTQPALAGLIDTASGEVVLFGDEASVDDIVWTGPLPTLAERAAGAGVTVTRPYAALEGVLAAARASATPVHFLSPYRAETVIELSRLTGIPVTDVRAAHSAALTRAVVALREIKGDEEIAEIERALVVTREMHLAAMKASRPGVRECEVVGEMEGIMRRHDWHLAYPSIFSRRGEVLHNHAHDQVLEAGDLVLNDTGAAADSGYASDITRTFPVGGRFSERQRALYDTVLDMQESAIAAMKPGVPYLEVHKLAARVMVRRMQALGFFRADRDPAEIVESGAYAIAFPHGLGHQIGMDVHDMEALGENLVGYGEGVQRSPLFGLGYLRLGKPLKAGMVVTVEPGVYFIPALIEAWEKEGRHADMIDYAQFRAHADFGGIRIEDNVLVTADGCRVLGPAIPKRADEVEAVMQG